MEKSIRMAEGIFGRCRTCMKNLLKGICAIACDPDQDRYLDILEEFNSTMQAGKTYASHVEFRMDPEYKKNVFESCKNVIHPASGRLALELACGTEISKCSPDQLFFYMGDPVGNPLVPFKLDYTNTADPNIRFTSETLNCSAAYPDDYACSCVDCELSCPATDPPKPEDEGFVIGGLNGVTFIVAMCVGGVGLILIIFGSIFNVKFGDLPQLFGGFSGFNEGLSEFFKWIGTSKLILFVLFSKNIF